MSGIVSTRMKRLGRWMVFYSVFILALMMFCVYTLTMQDCSIAVNIELIGLCISWPILFLNLFVGSAFCVFFDSILEDCQDPELCIMKVEVNLAEEF